MRPPTTGRAARRRSTARWARRPRTGRTPAGGCPSGRVVSSRRAKWRCRVRSDGAQPGVRPQDRRDLRRGAGRASPVSAPPPGRAPRPGSAAATCAGWRHQRVEPAAAPVPDPPVDRGPRHPDRLPERARHAHGRRGRGPAGPAAWSTAPGRRPPGSARTGTTRPCGPAPPGPAPHVMAGHVLRLLALGGERTRVGEAS